MGFWEFLIGVGLLGKVGIGQELGWKLIGLERLVKREGFFGQNCSSLLIGPF